MKLQADYEYRLTAPEEGTPDGDVPVVQRKEKKNNRTGTRTMAENLLVWTTDCYPDDTFK